MTGADDRFRDDERFAKGLDAADELAGFRDRFLIPKSRDGGLKTYLCGNSLGLQPRAAAACVEQELRDWGELGVDGHFEGTHPWFSYHEVFHIMVVTATSIHFVMVARYVIPMGV